MSSDDEGAGGGEEDLAAEVAALSRLARETDAIARESAAVLSELAPQVHDLTRQAQEAAGESAGAVQPPGTGDHARDAARAELGMRDEPPAPWCWPLLDAEQATAAWTALLRWVDHILVPGYGITRGELPDCWPQHPRMVNELSWLRAAHLAAHTPDAAASLAADWHLRALPGALAAVAAAVPLEHGAGSRRRPLCGPGHHDNRAGVHDDDLEERAQQPARREHRDLFPGSTTGRGAA